MKDRTDDHLNGGGVIAEHEDGIIVWVIATIGGGILIPNVCFAPLNCFAYNTTKLGGGQLLGLCLKIYLHLTKIQQSSGTTKKSFLSIKNSLPLI